MNMSTFFLLGLVAPALSLARATALTESRLATDDGLPTPPAISKSVRRLVRRFRGSLRLRPEPPKFDKCKTQKSIECLETEWETWSKTQFEFLDTKFKALKTITDGFVTNYKKETIEDYTKKMNLFQKHLQEAKHPVLKQVGTGKEKTAWQVIQANGNDDLKKTWLFDLSLTYAKNSLIQLVAKKDGNIVGLAEDFESPISTKPYTDARFKFLVTLRGITEQIDKGLDTRKSICREKYNNMNEMREDCLTAMTGFHPKP